MKHEQSSDPNADASRFGLKFDSEKPRWELVPYRQLLSIIGVANFFRPSGRIQDYPLNVKEFDPKLLMNLIMTEMSQWRLGVKTFKNTAIPTLAIAAFEVFFLLRGKSYSQEDLTGTTDSVRWDMFDLTDIEGIVDVYTMGAKKYSANNWQRVDPDRYFGAMMRHFRTITTKDIYDSELGCKHLHQVIWNMMALMWTDEQPVDKAENEDKKNPGE